MLSTILDFSRSSSAACSLSVSRSLSSFVRYFLYFNFTDFLDELATLKKKRKQNQVITGQIILGKPSEIQAKRSKKREAKLRVIFLFKF